MCCCSCCNSGKSSSFNEITIMNIIFSCLRIYTYTQQILISFYIYRSFSMFSYMTCGSSTYFGIKAETRNWNVLWTGIESNSFASRTCPNKSFIIPLHSFHIRCRQDATKIWILTIHLLKHSIMYSLHAANDTIQH